MFLQPEEGLRQEVMFSVRSHKGWGSKCQGGHEEALATPVTDHNTETGSWKLRFKGTEGVTGFLVNMKRAVSMSKKEQDKGEVS